MTPQLRSMAAQAARVVFPNPLVPMVSVSVLRATGHHERGLVTSSDTTQKPIPNFSSSFDLEIEKKNSSSLGNRVCRGTMSSCD